ncbi:hypothetical protein Fmac_014224 [Flemingia macrophylla]|uniref:Gamma-interferon-inducible lysosomal thiol reductase n=1 Tax=Flemingia macrophylla TaxID=520843 RepID=A0ABD1MB34_9FABA
MASSSSSSSSLALFLFLSFSAFLPPSESHKSVSVEVYYESLCPYSANFIFHYLPKLFASDLISIVDLKLVPWGNAKLHANNTFTCQHGPTECLLNTVQACVINIVPDPSKHFPFIHCVEDLVLQGRWPEWESCFEKLDLDSKCIKECYNCEQGKELELQNAAKTNCLNPPHKMTPWVVVDGQALNDNYPSFVSYICKAYKGPVKTQGCTSASHLGEFKANAMLTWEKIRSIIAS